MVQHTMSVSISDGSIVSAITHQVSCDLSGEAVILNLRDGVYYGLNSVGARIWSLLEEPRSVRELRALLLDEYDIDPEVCAQQLVSLLSDLAAHGLLEVTT
jgi:hypothetical protein